MNDVIYSIALFFVLFNQIFPPNKRKSNWSAFFSSPVGYLVQRYEQFIYGYGLYGFAPGSDCELWVSGTAYTYNAHVLYRGAIYEMINFDGITSTTPPNFDTANWSVLQNNWICARERVKYTSSTISMELALNHYFNVGAWQVPFERADHGMMIWIENTPNDLSAFWLANDSNLTSHLANSSTFQPNFLGDEYSVQNYDFIIHVPLSVWTNLGANDTVREGVIRMIADKQCQCDKNYQVVTYL